MAKLSAGLLMYRVRDGRVEVFLVHPGGPFFRNKDKGAWTIPKGEIGEGEEPLVSARREFKEETGLDTPEQGYVELGAVKQKGGKTVQAWAFAGELPPDFQLTSNTFSLEWPPRSGHIAEFPECDRGAFFATPAALEAINPAQAVLIALLMRKLTGLDA